MRRTISLPGALRPASLGCLAAVLLVACQKDVEPEKMEAARDWDKAICECPTSWSEAAKCQAKNPMPELELVDANGKARYHEASVRAFRDLMTRGVACNARINANK